MGGLIKLRDLPDNFWNADTLRIGRRGGPKKKRLQ